MTPAKEKAAPEINRINRNGCFSSINFELSNKDTGLSIFGVHFLHQHHETQALTAITQATFYFDSPSFRPGEGI